MGLLIPGSWVRAPRWAKRISFSKVSGRYFNHFFFPGNKCLSLKMAVSTLLLFFKESKESERDTPDASSCSRGNTTLFLTIKRYYSDLLFFLFLSQLGQKNRPAAIPCHLLSRSTGLIIKRDCSGDGQTADG